eukprot:Protomagalhaensia_sp_Gyna_25__2622@NODE_2493_length_1053_cov_16_761341_g2066_i0_p1_GENE_NODE_2493_length_1053_cov_16_761341_g2066_i0NODE_2493_length_1053_cov_16_761341_g2066_i0_p1_ORF_typecomplete_len181_score18_45DUF4587/PF15248_6/0_017DUF4134/PF13572_6/0_035Nucleos_tra2_C/PF07662_13/0_12_NODE_2493_length_1053_cov_16_761341_g2066_i063605
MAFVSSSTLPSSPDLPGGRAQSDSQREMMDVQNHQLHQLISRREWSVDEELPVANHFSKELVTQSKSYSSSDCILPRPVEHAEFVAVPIPPIDASVTTSSYNGRPGSSQIKESVELLLTFTAVVALWGAVDVIVEMISGDNLRLELITYIVFATVALCIQVAYNKLCSANISFVKALDRF